MPKFNFSASWRGCIKSCDPGPVLLLVLAPSLTWCHRRHEAEEAEHSVRIFCSHYEKIAEHLYFSSKLFSPVQNLAPSEHVPSPGFTLALTATFLLCYSLNLVISELYIQDSFAFLLVKA